MGVRREARGANLSETAPDADLGGSSKYSNGNFEDWSGARFYMNSSWTRVQWENIKYKNRNKHVKRQKIRIIIK